jgi:two-component system cell cycle sensor histidine kinase/response regulator CckA
MHYDYTEDIVMPVEEETARKQILVVEDEGLIAADLQKRLERMGYSAPAIAHSGEEALGYARKTPFDLVLMDIRLKGPMDGVTTAQRLKHELQMPVVYITAHADHDTVERAKLTEPFGYVIKPVADASLRSAVQIAIYKNEMERRLRTSEGWLATTLGSVGDGIMACDTSGEIVFMNRVAEQLTGWESGAAKGKLLMDVLGLYEESSPQAAKNPVYDLFPGEHRVYSLVSKSGSETAVEIGCVENRAGDELLGAILVLRNIGPRREMERRLLQSQRMEAVAGMAGGLAHDFNNLLMIMMGSADELYPRLSGEEQRLAAEIKQSASMASSITKQLLILSRRDAARVEILNLNDVICEMQPLVSHTLGRVRTLATDYGSPAPFVRSDRSRVKQALLNLALNARDAMPSGGELRISTAAIDIEAETPQGRQYRPGRYARLCVADNGKGMDKATLARIFEPFFTTRAAGEGTGLGLAIVHSIVVQSGGYITATSEPGRGTTFEILLPAMGTFQGSLEERSAEGSPVTVLLVEDENKIRRLMHGYLEREGFQLLEASNAEEAEAIAAAYRDPIHVLVADVFMPGRNGSELARRLAPLQPDMKVLFVSGYRHDALDQFEGAELLLKPFPASELVRRVRKLVAQPVARIA